MLKKEKSANRIDHQTRKTEVFWQKKKRKTDQKNIQNRKIEKPNAPLIKQRRFGSRYVLIHSKLKRSNTKNQMNGREMFRQTRAKQTNAQTQARQANKQMVAKVQDDACCPSSKKQFKQQQQQRQRQRRLKNDSTWFKLWITRESEFIQWVVSDTVRNIPDRIYKTSLQSYSSRSLKYIERGFSLVVLRTFVNSGKEMNTNL